MKGNDTMDRSFMPHPICVNLLIIVNYGSVSNTILERLKDQYLQLWRDNIYHSVKGTDYRIFKEIIKLFLVSASAPRLV